MLKRLAWIGYAAAVLMLVSVSGDATTGQGTQPEPQFPFPEVKGDKDDAPLPTEIGGLNDLPVPFPGVTGDKEEVREPLRDPEDDGSGRLRLWTRRYLRVFNRSQERITIFLHYRRDIKGVWNWLPGQPSDGNPLTFFLDPGQEMKLDHEDRFLSASRVRLWAHSDNWVWEKYKDQDLWLVEEKDAQGEHRYQATELREYRYHFAGADFGTIARGDQEDPFGGQPNVNPEVDPFGNPPPPAQPPANFEPPPFVVIQDPNVQPPPVVDIQPDPALPEVVIPRDADLGVFTFKVSPNGFFNATLVNRGPAAYRGGRMWALFQTDETTGRLRVAKQGIVTPLGSGRLTTVFGKVGGLDKGSRLVLSLTPGDNNPGNDFSGLVFIAPSKADLEVVNLALKGTTLRALVRNNGPALYKGDRTFTLGDGLNLVSPLQGPVPALAAGAASTVSLDVSGAMGVQNLFSMRLSPGDDRPDNDTVARNFKPAKTQPDLAVTDVVLDGNTIRGTIKNNGPEDFAGGRTYAIGLGSKAVPNFIRDDQPAPVLAAGQSAQVRFVLNTLPSFKGQLFLALSAGDAVRNNDFAFLPFTPQASNRPADLAALSLTLNNGRFLSGIIQNVGGTRFQGGGRQFFLGNKNTKKKIEAIPALDPGASTTVSLDLGKIPAKQQTFFLMIAKDASDPDGSNETRTTSFVPTAPPVTDSDLAILGIDVAPDNKSFKIIIVNNGPAAFAGGTRQLERASAIPKKGTFQEKSVSIPAMQPGERQVVTAGPFNLAIPNGTQIFARIAPADNQPANDQASATIGGGVTPPLPGKTSDLAAVGLTNTGFILKGTIKNVGTETIPKGQKWQLESTSIGTVLGRDELGELKPGEEVVVQRAVNGLSGVHQIVLRLFKSNLNTDPSNDVIRFTFNTANPNTKQPDLAVVAVSADKVNGFKGTIKNNGPGNYTGGRTFNIEAFLGPGALQGGGQKSVSSGKVAALAVGQSIDVTLPIPGGQDPKSTDTKVTVSLTSGDDQAGNDTKTFSQKGSGTTPGKIDLAAVSITNQGNMLIGTVKNVGASKSLGGRAFRFARQTGGGLVSLSQGTIGVLDPNQTQTVQFDASALKGPQKVFLQLARVAIDADTSNDSTSFTFNGGGGVTPPGGGFDLIAKDLRLDGKRLIGVIANTGPDNFNGGGTVELGTGKNFVLSQGPIPAIPAKQEREVNFDLGIRFPQGAFNAFMQLKIKDTNPNNNAIAKGLNGGTPAPGGGFDLIAQDVKMEGRKLVGVITNAGPDNFPGGGTFELITGNTFVQKKGNIPPVLAKQSVQVDFDFAANTNVPPSFTAQLNLIHGNDKNQNNNRVAKIVKLGGGTPPIPAQGFDLIAKDLRLDGKRLIGVIANTGPDNFNGGGTVELGTGTNFVLSQGPIPAIPAKQEREVNFDLGIRFPQGAFNAFMRFQVKDNNAGNNAINKGFNGGGTPPGNKPPNLEIVSLIKTGNIATTTVKNVGQGKSGNGRTVTLRQILPSGIFGNLQNGVQSVPPLNPGEQRTFNVVVPANVTKLRATLNDEPGDTGSAAKDLAVGGGTPPVNKAFDLAVEPRLIGTLLKTRIVNKGNADYPGGGGFSIIADNRLVATGSLVRLAPGQALDVTDRELGSFAKATPVAVQIKLTNLPAGDANPGNDTGSVTLPAVAAPANAPNLEIVSLTKVGNSAVVTVRNLGKGRSGASRAVTLKQIVPSGLLGNLPGGVQSVPPLNPNEQRSFNFNLPAGVTRLRATLNSEPGDMSNATKNFP